jgi:hypothetical protein
MSEKTTRPDMGQEGRDLPSITPNQLDELIKTMRLVASRMDILEHRFEYLDRDVLKAVKSESERSR